MNGLRTIFLLFALSLASASWCQDVNEIIIRGNDSYRKQQYEPAKTQYEEALVKDSANMAAKFNLADTIYRLSKPEDALKSFDKLAERYSNPADKSRAFYNKGVVLTSQKKLEESIDAYKDALRQNPDDKDARENLQKALTELKKRTPPPQKKENKKKQEKKQKQQPKMDQKEAEQKLNLLEQKEKQLQQRIQQQKSRAIGNSQKDW